MNWLPLARPESRLVLKRVCLVGAIVVTANAKKFGARRELGWESARESPTLV
jgi:hypothetical protein